MVNKAQIILLVWNKLPNEVFILAIAVIVWNRNNL